MCTVRSSARYRFLVAALILAAACQEKVAGQLIVDAPPPRPVPAAMPEPPAASEEEQILRETRSRPVIPITVERVVQAVSAAGIALLDNKAVLAAVVGARYCRNVRATEISAVLVICEYQTPEAAQRGREVAMKKYAWQRGRETFVNGATTLGIVLQRPGKPSTDPWGMKVIEAFQKLR